eukprot:gene13382-9209_t
MTLLLLNSPSHEGALQKTLIEPHPTQPLLATGWTNPPSVLITDSEGEPLTVVKHPSGSNSCSGDVSALAWHPMERILIIGWSSGGVSVWSMPAINALGMEEKGADSGNAALFLLGAQAATHTGVARAALEHSSPVRLLKWTGGGQYLLSAAENCTVAVWEHVRGDEKEDATPTPSVPNFLWATKAPAPVRFAIPAQKVSSSAGEDVSFLMTDGGKKVYYIHEDEQVKECIAVEDDVVATVFDRQLRLLVTLSGRPMIDVTHLSESFVATPRFRRKVAMPNASGNHLGMALAGQGRIALWCGDAKVRIFNLETEGMHMVDFPNSGAHITSVSVEIGRNLLVAGTAEGVLAVYQPTKGQPTTTLAKPGSSVQVLTWEPFATHELGKHVDGLVLSPLGDVAVCSDGKLHVLHETVRMRAWDGVAAATQISGDMVVIESVTGCQCLLKSKVKVRGVSIDFPNIALWTGSQIDVFAINEANSTFSLINFIPSTSPAFAIHREGLLYVEGHRVIFKSLQLKVFNHITFTETEGVPIILNVMNDFVVAVSSKNVLRLARITSQDLKAIGPSRPLLFTASEEDDEKVPITVSAACINAQGRRIAMMTKVGPMQATDTRIWVYDCDTDKLSSFDFASRNEVPETLCWNTPEPNAATIGELEYLLLACETHGTKKDEKTLENGSGKSEPAKSGRAVHHDDIQEAMPNMENFAEKKKDDRRSSLGATNFLGAREHNIVTFFSTPTGLEVHNSVSLKPYQICLVGLTIPDFLLASLKVKGNASNPEDYVIEQKRLRDFDGLKDEKDVAVREALMKFSYYATIGNMDEAYRCIKTIKDSVAWQALARLCVSNGRLDVAAVCLATIQDGVAARGLREAREEYPDDKNVQLAALACGLSSTYPHMIDECERILRASKRYDMITDVFLACGKFEQAQRHSEQFDRIRIRPVAYKYAQFMESLQNMDAAIMWYYNAKCGGTDVPRIYYQTNHLRELQELVMPTSGSAPPELDEDEARRSASEDPQTTFAALFAHNRELLLWSAQHSERRHKISDALRYYDAAKDVYNVVRILCGANPPKIESAIELVQTELERNKSKFLQMEAISFDNLPTEPEPVGAAFFVGQHFEKVGDYEQALNYYRYAGAYASGVRVARRAERFPVVHNLASSSGDERLILESAIFLERKGVYDKAVALYRQIGATQCALNLCIRGGLYDTLHEISTTLAEQESDPQIFLNMAQHFKDTRNYQKAVEMLVFAKQFEEALRLCQDQNVTLTEEMAEAMTGDKNPLGKEEKREFTLQVANIAKDQGSWNLACKKFTQVGERMKAMKMLMRGGDVEKVIFFANHSRNAEMYTLAANFLQSQSWSTNEKIYRSIIQFYSKAKAYDSLMSFYDACSQMHIDEGRNYPEALKCLEECARTMDNAKGGGKSNAVNESKLTMLKARIEIMRSFVHCQQLVESMSPDKWGTPEEKRKSDETISICSDYIKRSRTGTTADRDVIEEALRIGDVFALLVKLYFLKMKEPKNALKVLESMPKHGVDPQYYLEMRFMEQVCNTSGKQLSDVVTIKGGNPSPRGVEHSVYHKYQDGVRHHLICELSAFLDGLKRATLLCSVKRTLESGSDSRTCLIWSRGMSSEANTDDGATDKTKTAGETLTNQLPKKTTENDIDAPPAAATSSLPAVEQVSKESTAKKTRKKQKNSGGKATNLKSTTNSPTTSGTSSQPLLTQKRADATQYMGATRHDMSFPEDAPLAPLAGASRGNLSSEIPRFRLVHPHGFRMLKKSSAIERSMRNYFRLPEAPSDAVRHERLRVQRQLVQMEKDELVNERRIAGGGRSGVALDGFLLLNAANTEAPEEVEIVTLQTSKLVRSVPEDLSYFQNLFFLDVSENDLLLEDLLMLGGLETLHIAYNKIVSLRGIDDVLQWQMDHQKSIITEFKAENEDDEDSTEISPDALLPRLTALNISYNRIPPSELSMLSYFPSLQQLDLSGNGLGHIPLEISALVSVTHLALENNNLSSSGRAGADVFAALSTMPSLVEVNLNHNKLSAVPPLASVPGHCFFPALEVVGLTHNQFKSPESVLELARLHQTLRRVALSDNPLAKDPGTARKTRVAFDSVIMNAFDEAVASTANTGDTAATTADGSAGEHTNGDDTWQNDSWSRLIPAREETDAVKLDVKSAAAAAAAAAAAERQNESREDAPQSRPAHDSPLFPPDEEYVRCDDIVFDEDEEDEEQPAAATTTADDPAAPPQAPVCEDVPQFASASEYLESYYVEILFKDSFMPKRSTRHFLSMTTSDGTRSQLVTIPEYQEFMDIYRIAGGKRARYKRQEQRKKQKGVRSPTPLIITKETEEEQQMDPLSSHSSSPRHTGSPRVEEETPLSEPPPAATQADDVFLTAVGDEFTKKVPETTTFHGTLPRQTSAPRGGAQKTREVLPTVCPVTTNVHAAMTELRALLRKPLPSLPYSTAHLTAPTTTKITRGKNATTRCIDRCRSLVELRYPLPREWLPPPPNPPPLPQSLFPQDTSVSLTDSRISHTNFTCCRVPSLCDY